MCKSSSCPDQNSVKQADSCSVTTLRKYLALKGWRDWGRLTNPSEWEASYAANVSGNLSFYVIIATIRFLLKAYHVSVHVETNHTLNHDDVTPVLCNLQLEQRVLVATSAYFRGRGSIRSNLHCMHYVVFLWFQLHITVAVLPLSSDYCRSRSENNHTHIAALLHLGIS